MMAGLSESVDSLRIRDALADQHDGADSADVRLGSARLSNVLWWLKFDVVGA